VRCPICHEPFRLDQRRVICGAGHSFDVARQGYVNLIATGTPTGTADTAAMVAARERFLAAGHFARLAELIGRVAVEHSAPQHPGIVVDLAGGTGYYLAAVLDRLVGRVGLCLDLSTPALRRAARAHPRGAALGADTWLRLPIAAHVATTVLSVFGPRNAAEIERILAPHGLLITASPLPEHLQQLVGPLGMIGIDPHKGQRQAATFERFQSVGSDVLTYELSLDHDDAAAAVAMGPSAVHVDAVTLASRIQALPDPVAVTVAVQVTTYAPPDH
jgi:23S rRNA (guanine745-N1)-methyltransferase